jgi:predicted DNA-binding transcriptional regulator AlpA
LTERLEGSEEQLARYRLLSGQAGVRSAPWGRRARPVSRRQREEGPSLSVEDEILTTEEVCILLKIKKATLYRHTSQGTGPPFHKIGKHLAGCSIRPPSAERIE